MNWGKFLGIVLAVAFILVFIPNIEILFNYGTQQVSSLYNLQDSISASIISANSSYIVLQIKNPLNVSVDIINISGQYIYSLKPYTIPPHGSENITLKITDYSNFINNVNNNSEVLKVNLRILNTTLTEVQTL